MNLAFLSPLRLGHCPCLPYGALALALALSGCETHPLLDNLARTRTYVGTETRTLTTQNSQTYTATQTTPMITLPTPAYTQTNTWTNTPTNNNTTTYPATVPNTITPTWTATRTITAPGTYATTGTWTATTSMTYSSGTGTWTITYPVTTTSLTTTRTSIGASVTFLNGQAQGAMTGWGWVAGGAKDQITEPSCNGKPYSPTSPCTTGYTWNPPTGLWIAATIPALPAAPVQSDYEQNWGVMIGVNAREPNGPIGISFSSIEVTLIGTDPGVTPRAQLHVAGDQDSVMYCAPLTGTAIPLTKFNTECWSGTGKTFDPALSSKVDKIMVMVPSGYTAITIRNLCLTSITFY